MVEKKDNWDKAKVILEPVGGLLTALAVAILGVLGSKVLEKRQIEETNARLYTELTSRREESESKLRTDMFNSIIGTFLTDEAGSVKKENFDKRILHLELLSYNFHEAIDLGPLFMNLDQQITEANITDDLEQKYLKRLRQLGSDITRKQIAVLEQYGRKLDFDLSFAGLDDDANDNSFTLTIDQGLIEKKKDPSKRVIKLTIVKVDQLTQSFKVRVDIGTETPEPEATFLESDTAKFLTEPDTALPLESEVYYAELEEGNQLSSKAFWISFYDFPMIDNIRLSDGYRLAIVLNSFDIDNRSVNITAVYFPGAYSSLKERPYYEELIQNLKQSREKFNEK